MIQEGPPPGSGPARSGRYSVLQFGSEWRLLCGASTIGQFPTFETARLVADRLCRAVANVGFDVDLTIQSQAGEVTAEHIPSGLAR